MPHPCLEFALSAVMQCSMSQRSILNLLLVIGTAVALFNSYAATAECKLPVKECPTTVKGLEIESVMIPGCCEWPCSLRKDTNVSIIIEFHTSE